MDFLGFFEENMIIAGIWFLDFPVALLRVGVYTKGISIFKRGQSLGYKQKWNPDRVRVGHFRLEDK